ncbi:MAG: DUF423 domain-containing protein [Bacteroidia bacterium]
MNTSKTTIHLKVGAIICAAYVALGAFGAHGLKPILTEGQMGTYETGLRYMIIHGMGLLLINSIYILWQKYNKWPSLLFYFGLLFFSVSLIIHALRDLIGIEIDVFAMFAPLGGLCFIAGWLVFAFSIKKS